MKKINNYKYLLYHIGCRLNITQFELASGQFSPSCTAAVRNGIRESCCTEHKKAARVVQMLYQISIWEYDL